MTTPAMAATPRRLSLAVGLLALRASCFVPGGVLHAPHVRLPPASSNTQPKMVSATPGVPPPQLPPAAPQAPIERIRPMPLKIDDFHQPAPLVPRAVSEPSPVQLPPTPELPAIPQFPGKPGESASPGLDFKIDLPVEKSKASATLKQWSKDATAAQQVSIDNDDEKTWKFWNGALWTLEVMKFDLKEGNPDTVLAIVDKETNEIKAIANIVTTEIADDLTNKRSKVVNVGYIAAAPKSDVKEELGVELFRKINYWSVASGRSVVFFAADPDTKDYYKSCGFDVSPKADLNGRNQVLYTEPQNSNGRKYKMVELQLDTVKALAGISVGSG